MDNILVAHANSFHTYGFGEALRGISAAGFDYIELSAVRGWTPHVDVVHDDPAKVRTQVESFGLEAAAVSIHSDLTTDVGVALGVRGIEWAAQYGVGLVTTAIGGHSSSEEDAGAFMARVSGLAEAAERSGVAVGLELHGSTMATGKQSRDVVGAIGSPAIGIKYDTGNVEFYGGKKARDDIHTCLDLVVNVDVKDKTGGLGVWSFPPPGQGTVDFEAIFKLLEDAAYAGPLTIEIEFDGEPWPSYDEVVSAMQAGRVFVERLIR